MFPGQDPPLVSWLTLQYMYLLLERSLSVDCMTGPWGPWSPCTRNGQNCGYRYGMISRTREVLESPSPNGVRCPSLVETRCCLMEMRRCVGKALRLFFCLITVLYLSHYVRTYLYWCWNWVLIGHGFLKNFLSFHMCYSQFYTYVTRVISKIPCNTI